MSLAIASTSLQQRLDDAAREARRSRAHRSRSSRTTRSARSPPACSTSTPASRRRRSRCSRSDRSRRSGRRPSSCSSSTRGSSSSTRRFAATCPSFRVADESVSEAVTIRHLLTHSSGIDGDNFADTGRGDDALEKYVATLRVAAAGASARGDDVVLQHRLHAARPRDRGRDGRGLGHRASHAPLRADAADAHGDASGGRPPLPRRDRAHRAARPASCTTAPAWGLPRTAGPPAAICSTATEVARFAQLHLAGGTVGDAQIVSRRQSVQAMQVPQIEVPSGGDGLSSRHWGLGWSIFDWGGRTVVGHDGGTIGQAAFLRVVPDAGVAVALLTNGGNPIALFRDAVRRAATRDSPASSMPADAVPPEPPLPVDPSAYVGLYEREGASIRVSRRKTAAWSPSRRSPGSAPS